MEKVFPRLLHLLAHHADFSKDEADLDDMITYLNFYLDCVGTSENYPLLFHFAQRVKQARDAIDETKSEVYRLLLD
jgi:sister chromatid cohesion protein PDS5